MQYQNRKGIGPVLAIRSDSERGICLDWSFAGMVSPSFQYYHIFVFVGKHEEESRAFFQSYYYHLKMGELFGVYTLKTGSTQRKGKILWNQKSGFNSCVARIKASFIFQNLTSEMLEQVTHLVSKRRGIISINIVCDSYSSNKQKLNKIKAIAEITVSKIRFKDKTADKIIFNLLSNHFTHSKLSSTTGFNEIYYDIQVADLCCQDLLIYIRSIVIKSLTLTIQTKQKFNILSCSSNQWFISDQMEIQKKYYALPRIKFQQYIKFLEIKREHNVTFQLNIGLNFTFFDDSQIRDRKKFIFQPHIDKLYLQNMNASTDIEKCAPYQFAKGVFIQTNLLKQDSYVLVCQIKQKQKQKSKKLIKNF